ncbi:MAG: hypothetical protein KAS30_00920 [Candidatus Diapherotrites archaeon]|nr:hypothetical protein [Candidatus Diapherotrites archaeon]
MEDKKIVVMPMRKEELYELERDELMLQKEAIERAFSEGFGSKMLFRSFIDVLTAMDYKTKYETDQSLITISSVC